MDNTILYRRLMPHGPAVRIRRTSADGVVPVVCVLEVDRRAGTPREFEPGYPPSLLTAEHATEREALAALEPLAKDDAQIARLLREKGLR